MRFELASSFRLIAFVVAAFAISTPPRLEAQAFASPVLVPTPLPPVILQAVDLNKDGIPDLVYTNDLPTGNANSNTSEVGLLLGDGHGHFQGKAKYDWSVEGATPYPLRSLAFGDMSGKGGVDLGIATGAEPVTNPAGASFLVEVVSRSADGTFGPSVGGIIGSNLPLTGRFAYGYAVQLTPKGPLTFLAEDLNNNLVLTFQAATLDQSAGTPFTFRYTSPLPGGVGPATFADLNGDGLLDVVVNGQTALSASIYFGNGDGTFRAPVSYVFDHNVHSLLLADMDGDGHPDMIVEGDSGAIEIFHGNADGTFATTSEGGTAPLDASTGNGGHLVAVADLNHDGKLDLITWTPQGISVLLNQGGMAFKLDGIYPAGSTAPTQFAVADFNQDGALDIALDAPGGISVLYGKAAPSVSATVTAAPEPSSFEAGFTITATLTAPAGKAAPTGQVTFSIPQPAPVGGTAPAPLLQTVTLQNGVASYTVPAVQPSTGGTGFLPGADTLTASYSGDSDYAGITSFTGSHRVNLGTTGVTLSPAPPLNALLSTYYYGQPVNGYVNFQPQDSYYPVTGTWAQLSNGVAVPGCTALPANSTAACPYGYPQLLDAGNYDFVETYSGDPINGPGRSPDYVFNVIPDITTVTSLTSSLNPAVVGSAITFKAVFAGNYATPFGTMTFMDGGTVLGAARLDATGAATLTTSALLVGTHPITAVFPGNIDFDPVTSGVLLQQILAVPVPVATTVTLSSSINPSLPGQTVLFTAAVTAPAASAVPAAGSVTFRDGSAILGSASLNAAGTATFPTSTLALGTHPITAAYAGQPGSGLSPALLPGTSPVVNQLVAIPVQTSFTLTVTPNPTKIQAGQSGIFEVTVTPPANDSVTPVTLTCSDSIEESTCGFLNPVIPQGGGTTIMMLTTTAPHSCGDPSHPYAKQGGLQASCSAPPAATRKAKVGRALSLGTPLFGAVLLLWPRRRRKHWKLVSLLMMTSGLLSLSGCGGNCTDLGTPLHSYTITLTGVSAAGATASYGAPVTHTVAVKLTVIPQ